MENKKKRFTLDLDPGLKQRLKAAAARKGVSMRQYCQDAIVKEMSTDDRTKVNSFSPNRLNQLREEIFQGKTLPGNSVDFIREDRESHR